MLYHFERSSRVLECEVVVLLEFIVPAMPLSRLNWCFPTRDNSGFPNDAWMILPLGKLQDVQMPSPVVPPTLRITSGTYQRALLRTYQRIQHGTVLLLVMERMLELLLFLWGQCDLHLKDSFKVAS